MSPETVLYDVRTLSSGTLASLIGETRYDRIEQLHCEFVAFCQATAAAAGYSNWQAAWRAFAATREFSAVARPT